MRYNLFIIYINIIFYNYMYKYFLKNTVKKMQKENREQCDVENIVLCICVCILQTDAQVYSVLQQCTCECMYVYMYIICTRIHASMYVK